MLGRARDVSVTLQQYRLRQEFILALQDQAVAQCGARVLDPLPFLCDGTVCFGNEWAAAVFRMMITSADR